MLGLGQVVESIHRLGGLAIASHVDRESFSILSQLGFVPEQLQIDALELSALYSPSGRSGSRTAHTLIDQIEAYPIVRFSDAHRLREIGTACTTFSVAAPTVKEFRRALSGEGGRKVVN